MVVIEVEKIVDVVKDVVVGVGEIGPVETGGTELGDVTEAGDIGLDETGAAVLGDGITAVAGITVVETGTERVVRMVDLAGQLITVGAQLVMVCTVVE